MITSSKISRILRTALVIAAWAQGSVTVGVAAHLSKPSERVSSRHGRCREPRDRAHRSAEEEGGTCCDYGFEVAGLQIIRWRAVVGNWASRRVAANVGFIFDGTVRRLLAHRGELLNGWIATLTREDPRVPQPWLQPVELQGAGIRLRAFRTSDVDRIVEACSDPQTSHWLVSMPRPYQTYNALAYLESVRELAARGIGVTWCMADPEDDRCLGSISLDGLHGYARRGEIGRASCRER